MFENEQSPESVTDESSQGSQESSASESPSQEAKATQETKQEQYVPYDRFKELVEDKNRFAKQFEDTQKELHALRSQFHQSQQPKSPEKDSEMVEFLKANKVEDKFIKGWKEMEALKQELNDLRQWRDTQSQQSTQQQVMSQFDKLCADNKVPDSAKETYLAMIRHKGLSNPNLGVQDLPAVFKSIHDAQAKFADDIKRAALSEYTKSKKTDSSVPSSSKGPAPKASSKPTKFSGDREQARSQMVQKVLQNIRQNRDA